METRLREVMCPNPRICTSTIKAVDAMLVSHLPRRPQLPVFVVFQAALVQLSITLFPRAWLLQSPCNHRISPHEALSKSRCACFHVTCTCSRLCKQCAAERSHMLLMQKNQVLSHFCVAQEMERPPRKVTFFPVVDDGRLVGLVTLHGLVSAGL